VDKNIWEYIKYLDVVHTVASKVIKDRKEKLKTGIEKEFPETHKKAFLDYLLETGELGETALRDEVNTFMLAGHDTTTVTTKWCLFLLGNYPGVQDQVQEELDTICLSREHKLTMDDIRSMKCLERCIKESMRIYTSVPLVGRLLTEEIQINGYTLPKGTTANLDFYSLHRDERYFPDPEVFDPDRFLPEHTSRRNPYAYLPFSAGMRNCLGQKFAMLAVKVILSSILHKFRVESVQLRDEIHLRKNITLKSVETIQLKLYSRN